MSNSAAQLESEPPTRREQIPGALTHVLPVIDGYMASRLARFDLPPNLRQAVEYALLQGGKRSRPALALHCSRAVGGTFEDALPAAMAVELIHAFSLVHDDLPAMDDDDLRRGLPTCHVKYGEAMAILAGDAMMSLAFQLLCEDLDGPIAVKLCLELAQGTTGMINGQVYDTLGGFEPDLSDASRLEVIHRNKTGALLRAACRMGAVSARATSAQLDAITRYGEAAGLMFQIVDDLLDIEQTAEHTGKRTGKDQDAGKLTYPAVHGVEASRRIIVQLHRQALGAIEPLGPAAGALRELADFLAVRTR